MAEKYGYDNEEEFVKNAQKKFSLVETGVLDQDNCRLLMLNVCIPVSVLSREENKKLIVFRVLMTVLSRLKTALSLSSMAVLRKIGYSRTECTWDTLTVCLWLTSGWRVCYLPTRRR